MGSKEESQPLSAHHGRRESTATHRWMDQEFPGVCSPKWGSHGAPSEALRVTRLQTPTSFTIRPLSPAGTRPLPALSDKGRRTALPPAHVRPRPTQQSALGPGCPAVKGLRWPCARVCVRPEPVPVTSTPSCLSEGATTAARAFRANLKSKQPSDSSLQQPRRKRGKWPGPSPASAEHHCMPQRCTHSRSRGPLHPWTCAPSSAGLCRRLRGPSQ